MYILSLLILKISSYQIVMFLEKLIRQLQQHINTLADLLEN